MRESQLQLGHHLKQVSQLHSVMHSSLSLTINIINLRGPHEQHDEEVTATQECDQENDDHGLPRLAEKSTGHHGMRRKNLPDKECNDEGNTKKKGC